MTGARSVGAARAALHALVCGLVLAACESGGGDSGDEHVDEQSQALLEDRTVKVDVISDEFGLPTGPGTINVRELDQLLSRTCEPELMELAGLTTWPTGTASAEKPLVKNPVVGATVQSRCTTSDLHPVGATHNIGRINWGGTGWAHTWLHGCMGDMALRLAETPAGSSFKDAQLLEGKVEDADLLVPAPSASDRASLYILAAIHHQAAAVQANELLKTHCPADVFNDPIFTSAKETTTVGEVIASVFGHSMTRMMEAGERAQQYIAASAAANAGGSNDRAARLASAWRGENDSRLEGASLFVKIPPRMFEGKGYHRLWKVTNPDTKQQYLTTSPQTALGGFTEKVPFDLWLSPTPLASSSAPFAAWSHTDGRYSFNSTDRSSPTSPPGTGWTQIGAAPAAEGYGSQVAGPNLARLVRKCGPPVANAIHACRFGLSTDEFPAWATTVSELHYVFTQPPAGEYPVYSAGKLSEMDEMAEDLIRSYRLNPFADGETIALNLVALMNKRYRGDHTSNPFPDGAAFITGLFQTSNSTQAHAILKAAAERVKKRAEVLGQALVPVPGTSNPVQYTVAPSRGAEPPSAAVLYARTASSSQWDAKNTPNEHALAATMSRLLFDYHTTLKNLSVSTDMKEVLDGAAAYASTFVGPDLFVQVGTGNAGVLHGPNAPPDQAESRRRYEVWVGLAGLECALNNAISGTPCNPKDYKFKDDAILFGPAGNFPPYGVTLFDLVPAHAPPATAFGLPVGSPIPDPYPTNIPMFITRKIGDGKREVVVSFYPGHVNNQGGIYPPLGPGLSEALTRGLAPDPDEPDSGLISCAGVPHNAKVLLEDELIAVNHEDQYDESFRYYLNQATLAAKDADQLGNDIIRQGLEMDLRAEAALEELEDLCGGEIDIAELEKVACASNTWRCDLVKMLEDPAANLSAELQATLDGARACFGIGPGSQPVTVAIGDQPLCAWTYGMGGMQADPSYTPCLPCPANASCPSECPIIMSSSGACNLGAPDAKAVPVTDLLAVWATRKDFDAPTAEDDRAKWLIARHVYDTTDFTPPAQLGHPNPAGEDGLEQWRTWVTDRNLSMSAYELGYFKDFESEYAMITNGGNPLADLDQLYRSWNALRDQLSGQSGDARDPYKHMAWPCGAVNKTIHEMCELLDDSIKPIDPGWPLVCGHMCGVVGDDEATKVLRAQLESRLIAAVKALKVATGASWGNVTEPSEAFSIAPPSGTGTPTNWPNMFNLGRLPAFHEMMAAVHKPWLEAFLLGDFEYAGFKKESAVFYGTPPASTGSSYGRCLADDQNLTCQFLRSPTDEDLGPPSIWHDRLCIDEGFTQSSSTIGPDSSSETDTTTRDVAGCAAVSSFLAGEADEISFKRTVDSTTTIESWCVALQIHTKIDRRVRKDIHKYEDVPYEACFPTRADADKFADEVNSGALDALAAGQDMRACNTSGNAKVCAALTTLEPLGIVDKVASFFRKTSSEVVPKEPVLKSTTVDAPTQVSENTIEGLDFLDGLALAHVIAIQNQGTCDTLWRSSPEITGISDFQSVKRHFECSADRVELQLSRMTMPGVPRDLIPALRDASQAGAYLTQRGEYGDLLAKLITASQNLGRQAGLVGQATRNLALEFELSEAKLKAVDLNVKISNIESYINQLNANMAGRNLNSQEKAAEIQRLRLRQSIENIANQAAIAVYSSIPTQTCGLAALGCTSGIDTGAMAAAGAQTANSLTNITLENQVAQTQGQQNANEAANGADQLLILQQIEEKLAVGRELNELEKQTILVELKQRVLDKADAINEASISLNETYGEIQSLLTQLESVRAKARRAAAKALMLETDGMGRQYHVNTTMRATMNTLKVRYERARDAAVRLAHLARRAIEQKLGLDLSKVVSDIGPVQAPSEWIDSVCTLSGINYDEIRNVESTNNDTGMSASGSVVVDENGRHYADAYVGEYVAKLEQLVEAYRAKYPFGDGPDTMVVSLRDELLGITKPCDVSGPNELYQTENALGEHWYTECDSATCLAARADATGPFQCSGYRGGIANFNPPGEALPDNGQHGACATIGGATSVELTYTAGRDATTAEASTRPAEHGDVLAIDDLGLWTIPEDCDLTNNLCGGASPQLRGSLVPAGATAPLRYTSEEGAELLQFSGNARLVAENDTTMHSQLTYSFVASATIGLKPWQVDVPRAAPRIDRYIVEVMPDLKVRFTEIQNAHLASGSQTIRHLSSSALVANQLYVITVRASLLGKEIYVNGRRDAADAFPIAGATLSGEVGSGSGYLGQTLGFGRALNLVELAKVHSYLGAHYGIHVTAERPAVTEGLVSWVRADHCSNAAATRYCSDLARVNTNYALPNANIETSTELNSQPVLRRTSAVMSLTGTSDVTNALTMLAVVNPTDRSGSNVLLSTDSFIVRIEGFLLRLISGAGAGSAAIPATGPFVVGLRIDGRNVQVLLDGRVVIRLAVTDQELSNGINALPAYGLGVPGVAAEMLVFERALGNVELQAVQSYLTQRYNRAFAGAAVEAPRYVQSVPVTAGGFLLTWYEPTLCSQPAQLLPSARLEGDDIQFLDIEYCIDNTTPYDIGIGRPGLWLRDNWSRRGTVVNVREAGVLTVGFEPNVPAPATAAPYPEDYPTRALFVAAAEQYWNHPTNGVKRVKLAAPQLERVENAMASTPPSPYFPTDDDLQAMLGQCPDLDGEVFNTSAAWTKACEYYCPYGTGRGCEEWADTTALPKRCYRQIQFQISMEDIETGKLIPQGGFARGNFNYRFDKFAVNMVGTAVKNCGTSALPQPCYANNFLQFTLHHDEPFRVRNHDGRVYYAPLHPGRVQQGKALAAERYLTNPISSADRGMLEDYWRTELRGRPLEGNYTLRIYENEEVDFTKLEDVQFVMKYRYWTRFE
jgi:hypothetical protein